jgi:hypothetical protein
VKKSHFILQLAAGCVLILVSIYGFLQLNGTWLPQDAQDQVDQALASEGAKIELDGGLLEERIELEFFLCRRILRKQVGDPVLLEISGVDTGVSRSVQLIPYFEAKPLFWIHLIVLSLSALIGFVVFVMK